MDNNVLASPQLAKIVEDLEALGYGRGQYTNAPFPRERCVDFNQGVDAFFVNEKTIKLISRLNIRPFRIAFDDLKDRDIYLRAVRLAFEHGFRELSNYLLFNFGDTPRDLYERLRINIELNKRYRAQFQGRLSGCIYSYPMRYAPISDIDGAKTSRRRDYFPIIATESVDWRQNPRWTPKFVRNIEIMKGATHGAISPTPELALRAVGEDFHTFVMNLYMPEELIRNRDKHEANSLHRRGCRPGTGKIEQFREFMSGLLSEQGGRFARFHNAVTPNSLAEVRKAIAVCNDEEMRRWLELYTERQRGV
jgi:hypothetical protein